MKRPYGCAALAVLMLSPAALAQVSTERAGPLVGEARAKAERLVLVDRPRATGSATALFDGRSLDGWQVWLGYADPGITLNAPAGAVPIGTGRDPGGDVAVRAVDGAPAIWIKGETWAGVIHRADLRDYHLRLQYKWGARTWAPRAALPRNNGLLYHSHGEAGAVFGTWQPSIEFDILQGSVGMAVPVGAGVRARSRAVLDPALVAPHLRYRATGRAVDVVSGDPARWNVEAATDAERPIGEWNTLDLYVVGDRAIHVVNGVPVVALDRLATTDADGARRPLTHGRIQLQSEGAETWFRAITVEPIRALPRIAVARNKRER